MKKLLCIIMALLLGALISACTEEINPQSSTNSDPPPASIETSPNNSNSQQESDTPMGTNQINGFDTLKNAPLASEVHESSDIIKILFYEAFDGQTHNAIAIDIGSKMLYTNPDINFLDLDAPDYSMTDDDIQIVLDILDNNNILDWNAVYSVDAEYEDGYGWVMYIQYSDGTVNRFIGSGPVKDSVIPENFDVFVEEMITFIKAKA